MEQKIIRMMQSMVPYQHTHKLKTESDYCTFQMTWLQDPSWQTENIPVGTSEYLCVYVCVCVWCVFVRFSFSTTALEQSDFVLLIMAGAGKLLGMDRLKAQNLLVAGGLTAFVGAVYMYTMKAVGSGDDLQEAVQKFEAEKAQQTPAAAHGPA